MPSCSEKYCYKLYLADDEIKSTHQKILEYYSNHWSNNEFPYIPRYYPTYCEKTYPNIELCAIKVHGHEHENITNIVQKYISKKDLTYKIIPEPYLRINTVRFPVEFEYNISLVLKDMLCPDIVRGEDFHKIPHNIDIGQLGNSSVVLEGNEHQQIANLEKLMETFKVNTREMDLDSLFPTDTNHDFQNQDFPNFRLYWNYNNGHFHQIEIK